MSQSPIPLSRKHLPALDAVRGVAILGVFCYHLLAASWGGGHEQLKWGHLFRNFNDAPAHFLWFYPFTFGWIGVSLFFVLSGFVIHYSTITSSQPFSTANFYSRRFWRIYPPYALAIVLFCLLPSSTPPADARKLSILTHALLLQDFSNKTFALINPSFWSIATEVQFYLVYPLLLLFRSRLGMFKVLLGVLSFSFACRVLLLLAKRHDADCFEDSHLMLWASPMITIFDWTLGAFVAERFSQGRRVFPDSFAILIVAAVLFIASTFIRPLSMFSFQFGSVLSAICIERAVWTGRRLSLIEKLLIPLGLCSYSFYLFHQPLLEIMVEKSRHLLNAGPVALASGCGPIIFLLLLGLSWVIYRTVEKPSMQFGKRFSFGARKIERKRVDSASSGNAPVMDSDGPGSDGAAGNLADLGVAGEATR